MSACRHPANAHTVMPADWTRSQRVQCHFVTGHDVGSGRPLTECPCDTKHFGFYASLSQDELDELRTETDL